MSGGEQVIRGKYGCAWCGRTEPDTDPRRPWLCVRFDGLVGFVARFHSACAGILVDSMVNAMAVPDAELDRAEALADAAQQEFDAKRENPDAHA